MVILDPLHLIVRSMSYEARRILLAIPHAADCAIIVVSHLNAKTGSDARGRSLGGSALPHLSRATYVLAPHPDDGEAQGDLRILANIKMNRGAKPRSLAGRKGETVSW